MNVPAILVRVWLGAMLLLTIPVKHAEAQRSDTLKSPPKPVVVIDTARRARTGINSTRIAVPRKPPLTPKQAFIYSLILPGLGQSRLDRGSAGAFFAAIELGALAMVQKSSTDLREVRKFSGDSLPNNYTVQTDGKIVGVGSFPAKFPVELINTRRLHVEDWFAALAFNHLLAGADAFVAGQLWEVPASLSVVPGGDRITVVATIRW